VQETIKELEINMSMKENSLYNLPNEIYCVDMGGVANLLVVLLKIYLLPLLQRIMENR
jgi:hypothetical protein